MILVTGGAGYIGSHTCIELQQAGFDVLVVDNLSNSSQEALARAINITGREVSFIEGDIRDAALMKQVFSQHNIEAANKVYAWTLRFIAEFVTGLLDC